MSKCCIVSTSVVCTAMQAMCEQRSSCILCTKHQHCSYFKPFACLSSHSFALPSSASANWSCLRSIQSVEYTCAHQQQNCLCSSLLKCHRMSDTLASKPITLKSIPCSGSCIFKATQPVSVARASGMGTCAAHMTKTSDGVATSIEVPERRAGQQLGHGKSRMISQSVAAYEAKAVRLSQIQEAASELCICVNQACFTGDSMGTNRKIKPDCIHVYMSSIPSICSNTIYMSYYTL